MTTPTPRHLTALPTPGPQASDAELGTWRDAAADGGLPAPTLPRWQVLRAGVVNLWEFDVAEYWYATGRAQFVGANQSGKSTLMALTTLILLAGDLDRSYVDTFGQQDKSFRYYVEPTDDPRDRRETSASTNRGWAWAEYGRLTDTGPEFFTTLLYAQAKRGVKTLTPAWVICQGQARVRAGLHLADGQATTVPAQLADVPGVTVCASGKEYTALLAGDLFGFTEAERLATVIEMLKVLRTPHLGQKLNPDWFTEQMRAALPAVARTEIDELAEGWAQLEQLGRDRDSAAAARDAVKVYLQRAWRPWADAVLRRAADELIAANTAFDNVTRRVRDAQAGLDTARSALTTAEGDTERLKEQASRAQVEYEQLLESDAYRDATARTQRAQKQLAGAKADADKAAGELAEAADRASEAVSSAGLGEAALEWVSAEDTDRLEEAVKRRRAQVQKLRELLRTADTARAAAELAATRAQDAEAEYTRRAEAATAREDELTQSLQGLSDSIEAWAASLGEHAPDPQVREQWIGAVTDQANQTKPRAVLRERIRRDWLDPATGPLTEQAAIQETRAKELRAQAGADERRADEIASAADPVPAAPDGWTRRDRPAFPGPGGAPLWRLLDPADGLDQAVLDHIEAGLAAAGLLDTWVTTDGLWLADRDEAEATLTPSPESADRPDAPLSRLLRPAADAGPLTGTVARWLAGTGYAAPGEELSGATAVAGDGRWRTPTAAGCAMPAAHGATQIGTAARAAHRARLVTDLRTQAAQRRVDAADADTLAEQLRTQVRDLQALAAGPGAPDDADVVHCALAAAAAQRERASAETKRADSARKLTLAEEARDRADTAVLNFAAEHTLPTDPDGLEGATRAVDALAEAVAGLRLAVRVDAAAQRAATSALDRERGAATEHQRTADAARAARALADAAKVRADEAERLLGQDDKALFARKAQLDKDRARLATQHAASETECRRLSESVTRAEAQLKAQDDQRRDTETRRAAALDAWWVPVDAGLAADRGLPAATGRTITHGRDQASAARAQLRPPNWPESADAAADKATRVEQAWARLTGNPLMELRAVLESSGGRSASIVEADETGGMSAIVVLVDASGVQVSPTEAVARLDEQVTKLAQLHDEKMHQVLVELLSSTFVEHLRDRLAAVVALLRRVNRVLEAHPTGANRTTLRLRRLASEGQRAGFDVLRTLEQGFVDSPEVQEQVRAFLAERIHEAQELGRATASEWTDHLSVLLDYRRWFDVIAEYRVGASDWKPLTRQVHGVDSGGGKVVTLLQPLLATLVALYDESETAPRPLWLDEAFEGVDAGNRATMLDLLVEFNLDFLLAGPGQLVAAAQVPAAALWLISRAPAPMPGVDLSLMLWAGRTLTQVPLPDLAAAATKPRAAPADPGDDLFSALTAAPDAGQDSSQGAQPDAAGVPG